MEKKEPTYNYFCRNEANSRMEEIRNATKKQKSTSYSDTLFTTVPKSDENQYCSKNAAIPRATNFTLSTQGSYKFGGHNVVYRCICDG